MAIPAEKLVLNIDPDRMTLDDMEMLLEPEKFKASSFKTFMAEHSNWSAAEVGRLTLAELAEVSTQIGAALTDVAIPKGNATP